MKKRNSQEFTLDEAQTVTLIVTEGSYWCDKRRGEPRLEIRMCDKQALEPAARVFKTRIRPVRYTRMECPPELYPPNGHGICRVGKSRKGAEQIMEHLKPLLTPHSYKKWQTLIQRCRPKT